MSLVGFKCPDTVPTEGRCNDPDFCINDCPHRCMPAAILAKIWQSYAGNEHSGNMVTPSALGGCPRSLILERTEDYYQEPPKLYHAVRGSLIHAFLEGTKEIPDTLREQRVYKRMVSPFGMPYVISGRFDYVSIKEKTLEDYKSTQDKTTYFLFNTGAKEDHVLQTNVYRWLLHGGSIGSPDADPVYIDIDRIVVHYLFMGRVISTGSTVVERVNDYNKPRKPYKLQRSMDADGFDKHGRPMWKITIDIPDVPVMPLDDVEAYVQQSAPELVRAFTQSPEDVRCVLGEPDQQWQCDWCGGYDRCMKIESAKGQPTLFDLRKTIVRDFRA